MAGVLFFVGICTAIGLLRYYGYKDQRHRAYTAACPPPPVAATDIVFKGQQLGLTAKEIHTILEKRCSYFSYLEQKLKLRFVYRVQSFMRNKIFVIKDDEGFKDMPVLISAAAVQLTFGLKDYRLPFYQYIRIYPEEFIADNSFAILAGRVNCNMITVAWNHFLEGNKHSSDGANVGLHEMSHALYIQKMVIEEHYAKSFYTRFAHLITECKEAFDAEAEGKKDLYSSYANTNLQEFWAESIELFFEKPEALKSHYPDVFVAMNMLLNQNPLNKSNPLLEHHLTFKEKMYRLSRLFSDRRLGKTPLTPSP